MEVFVWCFTKIHKWLNDHITFIWYGLWSYNFIFDKYLQIVQPFVGDNLGVWYDKYIPDQEILLIFFMIMWLWLSGMINMQKLSSIYIKS